MSKWIANPEGVVPDLVPGVQYERRRIEGEITPPDWGSNIAGHLWSSPVSVTEEPRDLGPDPAFAPLWFGVDGYRIAVPAERMDND
jgi:hypothetical protein